MAAVAAKPNIILYYFNSRGRAETSRIIMALAGIPYTDTRIEMQTWKDEQKHKASMPYGQLPVLEVDGVKVAESSGIERFVARIGNLFGSNPLEGAMIDMITDPLSALFSKLGEIFFCRSRR